MDEALRERYREQSPKSVSTPKETMEAIIMSVDARIIARKPEVWSEIPEMDAEVWGVRNADEMSLSDLRSSFRSEKLEMVKIKIAAEPFQRGEVRCAMHARVQRPTSRDWEPCVVKKSASPPLERIQMPQAAPYPHPDVRYIEATSVQIWTR